MSVEISAALIVAAGAVLAAIISTVAVIITKKKRIKDGRTSVQSVRIKGDSNKVDMMSENSTTESLEQEASVKGSGNDVPLKNKVKTYILKWRWS